ncbi:MAG: GAF domain-containing protein [SAR202 cluster bacterium]|nr:GAF domain-containing protein [SAR202 cluster bacterium]
MVTAYPGAPGITRTDTAGHGTEGSQDKQIDIDVVAGLLEYLSQPDRIEEKCNRILAELISVTEADSASLRIRNESDGTLRKVAKVGRCGSNIRITPVDDLYVSDTESAAAESYSSVGSKVAQPVKVGGKNVGVVLLESKQDDHFTPSRVRFLGIIGDVVGLMLQHSKLSEHLQASLNELSVLDEVARIITSTLAIEEVYERFAVELQKLVLFNRVNINIVNQAQNNYTVKYAFGPSVPGFDVGDSGSLEHTVTGRVVLNGGTVIGKNLSVSSESATDQRFLEAGLKSCIMLPLVSKGKVIGTLGLRSRNSGCYGDREKEILERLAGQIAPAVENSALYEARRLAEIEERRRSGEMESLLNIANILGGPGSFVDKCKNALECLMTSPGVKTATLRVPVGDMEGMKLVAQAGGAYSSAQLVLPPDSLSALVFQRSQLLVIDDYQQHPLVNKAIQAHGMSSIIFMPVKSGSGRVLGLVNVASDELAYFTPERTRYFTALADGIGTLLENAELYHQMIGELEQRQKTEEALRESESRFRALAENTSDVMWELDASCSYTFCSPNIKAITGLDSSQVIGKSPFDFMPMAESARMRDVFRDLADKREAFYLIEHTVGHRDGRQFLLEGSGMPVFDKTGCFAGFRGVDRDVTERKAAEVSLQKASQLATVGELASGIAHELNNPLAAVMTFAHLLKSQDLPGGVGEDVEKIYTEAQRAARVVHNLLAFARRHEPEKMYVDVSGAVSRALSLKARDLNANNIEVRASYESGLPKTMADEHQLTQVFLNIVTNADQTMSENNRGGTLWISGRREGNNLRFSFRDDGPGISAEHIEKIFDPFFTTKEEGKGTGLGLSMCYRMVRAHGGKIWVESEEGQGTTFFVELPIEGPEGLEGIGVEKEAEEAGKIKGKRILVVDDETVFTDPLCRILSRDGHVVEVAKDGEEAWQAIGQKRYECILMDVRMPGVGGKELYRRIREKDEELSKRVIFATGDTLNPETQEFLENTGNVWLGKPFTVEELEVRIQECLAQTANTA